MQRSMFGMTAFIDDLQISLMAAADADQNVSFVVFTEVRTKTALSTLNGFHVCSSYGSRWGRYCPPFFNTVVGLLESVNCDYIGRKNCGLFRSLGRSADVMRRG
jgi:hypothetical protein